MKKLVKVKKDIKIYLFFLIFDNINIGGII